LIYRNLKLIGHDCEKVYDGAVALNLIKNNQYELIILDIMLPTLSGLALIKKITGVSVIFLTARDSLFDRVSGLNLGADDYITKPFEMLELIARVEAVLRRTSKNSPIFQLENIEINFKSRQAIHNGKQIDLTPKEFDLLEVLIINRNIALSREKLLELAWGFDYFGDSRTVDVHIQKLRKKLNLEHLIKTVYKLGYRLEV